MAANPYQAPRSSSKDSGRDPDSNSHNHPTWYLSLLVCTLPVISYLYVLLFWLLASASLGEWAREGLRGPLNFLFGIPLYLNFALFFSSFAAAPAAFVVGYRRKALAQHVLCYIICLMLSIALFRMDLFGITSWICDL